MYWEHPVVLEMVDRLAARSRSRSRSRSRVRGAPTLGILMIRDRRRPIHHQPVQWPAHLLLEHASLMDNLRYEHNFGGERSLPQTILQMRVWCAERAADQGYVFRNKGGGKTGGKVKGGAGEGPPLATDFAGDLESALDMLGRAGRGKGDGKGDWANAWRARAVVMGLGEPRRQIQRPLSDPRARAAALLAVPKASLRAARNAQLNARDDQLNAQLNARRQAEGGEGGGFAERARMDRTAEAQAAFLVLPHWLVNLQNELNFQPRQDPDVDAEDQRVLPPCAPRLLTAGGYNRHHHEVEVRRHVRACVYT